MPSRVSSPPLWSDLLSVWLTNMLRATLDQMSGLDLGTRLGKNLFALNFNSVESVNIAGTLKHVKQVLIDSLESKVAAQEFS